VRIALTGGGTGGHVYPALEVGRLARDRGAELVYLGSERGMESKVAAANGIEFHGFQAEPLWSLTTVRGWRSLAKLLQARRDARRWLSNHPVDAVFSTGGYSAGPVMAAARSLKIPYVVHEANSVPGRANRMFAKGAKAFTSVFRATATVIPGTIRTGQPIRRELREAAQSKPPSGHPPKILVTGGSQGAAALNEMALSLNVDAAVTLVCGPKNFEALRSRAGSVDLRAFLSADEMAEAYQAASLVIGRSGGSCAEFAAFRLPSVLVPLPTSADDHQRVNAREFSAMRAAVVVEQANPVDFEAAVTGWLNDPERVATARHNLEEWDCPHATADIVNLLLQ